MGKWMCVVGLSLISMASFAASQVEDAEQRFHSRVLQESARLKRVYERELKDAVSSGNLALVKRLSAKREHLINNVNLLLDSSRQSVIHKMVQGKVFTWGFGNQVYSDEFKLDKSGKVAIYTHENEASWKVNEKGELLVLNARGQVQWTFTQVNKEGVELYFEEPGKRYLMLK